MIADANRAENKARFLAAQRKAAIPDWYPQLLDAVAGRVQAGRQRAVMAANQELVATYWDVGKEILSRQDAEGWGTRVIDRLSSDLKERFPEAKGFSPRNLKYMRAFAAAWPGRAIVQAPLAQLPWYHHITLIEKLDSSDLNNVVAEYALRGYTAPIGVAEWKTAITASLPTELETSLPTVEELEAEFDGESDKERS